MKNKFFSKVLSKISFALTFAFLFFCFSAFAEPITVISTSAAGAFPLVSSGVAAQIVYDNADAEVVGIAAAAFAGDVQLVTNVQPTTTNAISTTKPVIIGTLRQSSFISQLVSTGKISVVALQGKWETFQIAVIDNPLPNVMQALVIVGSDPRGTAFGVFELSRMMGVSPWVWWADATPKSNTEIYVSAGESVFGPPSVKYRGFFINDEDWAMSVWAKRNMDTNIRPNGSGDMGPNTYAKIFELMLRMKANYLWPAMHSCTKAFWYLQQNPQVAKRYSIVMGSSHCEQMLRDNLDEWTNNYQSEYGTAAGDWNWATNSTKIKQYWADRVIQSAGQDAVYTLGMRGIHDSGIPGYSNDQDRKVALNDIIANQRTILSNNISKPIIDIPQVFIPYKEVLAVYKLGINLPEDVTLMWADDNFGYMRQLSNPTEQSRSGGGGIYYHFSYLGPPCSYLWLESVSPALTQFELKKAYDMNCKTMWIFNVGDIKPQEFSLQHAMDIAWDINTINLSNPNLYAKRWGEEIFGQQFGQQIYDIKREYFALASSGRPENLNNMTFTVKEMEEHIRRYDALVELSQALETQIPASLQDAYFQLIKYPVESAAAMNTKNLGARLSFEYGAQGRKDDALTIGKRSVRAFQQIIDLTKHYNTEMAGGKWNGMMSWSPNNSGYFFDQNIIQEEAVSRSFLRASNDSIVVIPAQNFTGQNAASQTFLQIDGLGISEKGIIIYPYNMTAYTTENIAAAPALEYSVPVLAGKNEIHVQCLPSFPLYSGLQLRYAISIDGSTPEFKNVASVLEGESAAGWGENVMKGFSEGVSIYESQTSKTISVKIFFADPALVLSAIKIVNANKPNLNHLIVNNSFEYASESVPVGAGASGWDGNNWRAKQSSAGEFYGWNVTNWNFRSSGNYSQGINKDMTNIEGNFACWVAGDLAFADFWEFYQVIPSNSLTAGNYKISCRLAVEDSKRTSQRLFANNDVQYHGAAAQYANNLTAGERNTFAGYPSGTSDLREMSVYTTIAAGDSLKIGIRTGRKKGDGTTAGNASPLWGWFKVDYFRLEKVEMDSIAFPTDTADYTAHIINPSFEITTGMVQEGNTFRGTPYGWQDIKEGFKGNSFGANNDATNIAGTNACWYLSTPMPDRFELYQTISDLPAGKYSLSARMAVRDNKIATQRLFANNAVQYYGHASDYNQNLTAKEVNSFAGWTSTSSQFLKDLLVEVEVGANEPLRIGVRSSNLLSNGTHSTGDYGWFKIDNFKLRLIERASSSVNNAQTNEQIQLAINNGQLTIIAGDLWLKSAQIFDITGRQIINHQLSIINYINISSLPQGLYLIRINSSDGTITKKFIKR